MAELLSRSGTVNVLPGESELNWSWPDYLITLYIGRRGNTFSIRQGTETRMFRGLVTVAVVVYVASCGRLRVLRQRLLRLRADRYFVLRGCLRRGLGWCFGCLRCGMRLGQGVDCLNRLNGIAHVYNLSRITSTRKEVT